MSGVRKVAILVAALGEEAAAVIYRQLPPSDVQQITAEVASLETVPPELAQQILEEYLQQSAAQQWQSREEPTTRLAFCRKAFGEENAKGLVKQASQTHSGGADWIG